MNTDEKFSDAVVKLAVAVDRITRVLEVLTESMPATAEARLLGISERTVRRKRKARQLERLLS